MHVMNMQRTTAQLPQFLGTRCRIMLQLQAPVALPTGKQELCEVEGLDAWEKNVLRLPRIKPLIPLTSNQQPNHCSDYASSVLVEPT